ncbi:hypothetical protein JCM19240_5332 [Vibrio maritimus]|uniref:Uncharacterized protein n=1 Tax=Vibrio maritimus TaxID=990268 RepID=A0A090SW23_9VIBR|nr:hypothetical protein JCM19240_5332 [Vibrio maritimus]
MSLISRVWRTQDSLSITRLKSIQPFANSSGKHHSESQYGGVHGSQFKLLMPFVLAASGYAVFVKFNDVPRSGCCKHVKD